MRRNGGRPTDYQWRDLAAAIVNRAVDDLEAPGDLLVRMDAASWLQTREASDLMVHLDIDPEAALESLKRKHEAFTY